MRYLLSYLNNYAHRPINRPIKMAICVRNVKEMDFLYILFFSATTPTLRVC